MKSFTLLVCMASCGLSAQSAIPVIDRTDGSRQTTLGLPATSGGGSPGETHLSGIHRLGFIIEDAKLTIDGQGILTEQIVLLNASNVPIRLPISLDQVSVHKVQSKNRRELIVSIGSSSTGVQPPIDQRKTVVLLFSSDSVEDSYYQLEPGHRVILRVACNARSVGASVGDLGSVYVEEYRLHDARYAILDHSDIVVSAKLAKVSLDAGH